MKDRAYVKSIFLAHASKAHISHIGATKRPYVYTCRLSGYPHTACLLACSSDYWMKRMHLLKTDITLYIVWKHDSCLSVPVLSLEDGRLYQPYTCAVDPVKRTKSTSKAFLGQLLCGVQSAYDALKTMPYQSKRRYERQLEELAHRKKGRPLKVSIGKGY